MGSVNLKRVNKKDLGRVLLPDRIYRLEIKKELEKLHEKLYFDNVNPLVVSNMFVLSILLSVLFYVILFPFLTNSATIGGYMEQGIIWEAVIIFATYFVFNLVMYYIVLIAYFLYHDSKFKRNEFEIEIALPEFIDNLVSNIKGGISLEKGLLKSVRPEQKALLHEVTLMNEKVMMGKDITTVMKEFRERFDSPIINRTFFLIEEGVKGGGNLAAPLERIADNLKRVYSLQEEIKGNSSGFAIVIRGITLIVAPLLFALALTLLTFIGNLFDLLVKSSAELAFVAPVPQEFSDYLLVFSYSMLILITVFSSLITSQLNNEKTYAAMKYLPIYIIVVILLFKFFSDLLLGFFGNVVG